MNEDVKQIAYIMLIIVLSMAGVATIFVTTARVLG